ncbi:MAG: YqiA/YcfP family alpha/beta fold hydrolase [Candidatus Thiodiazotropha sp.]|jgi:uncharacterized protein
MIVYLHGLDSTGRSIKAGKLREALPHIEIISPTYPAHSAAQAVEFLSSELLGLFDEMEDATQPRLLVGSSIGGFYGAWLAKCLGFQHFVMINPALKPWRLLKRVVGWHYSQALEKHYFLSSEMVEAARAFAIKPAEASIPTTLLLDKDDELIDYRIAKEIYTGLADIHCFEGGSHAFEHMDEAVTIIDRLHRALSNCAKSLVAQGGDE